MHACGVTSSPDLRDQLAALREAGVVEAELDEKGCLRRVMFGAPALPAPVIAGARPFRDEDEDRFGSSGFRPGARGEG